MPPPPPAEGIASRLFLGPTLRTQPDRRLVSLVRQGYETAFEEIVRRYGKLLGRYAAAIVPGQRAEDVTQDAFSKALLALRHSDAEIELRPWLFRIVRNTALNDIRDQPPPAQELFEGSGATGSALEGALRNEDVADLMRRLRALPEPQRAAIVMRELEGLSHEEIAAALGITGGAARQTIHRARQKLRDRAGLLIPMPALKLLLGGAAGVPAGAAAGAGVGGAAAGGGGGAAIGLKAAGAVLLVAGTVGTGVALKERDHSAPDAAPTLRVDGGSGPAATSEPTATLASDDALADSSGQDGGEGRGGSGSSGHGPGGGSPGGEGGNSGPGGGDAPDGEASHSGEGSGGGETSGGDGTSDEHHETDHSGSSGSGGDGGTTSGSGSGLEGGGSGSGDSGSSDSSGEGSGSSTLLPMTSDSLNSGSGFSGSGDGSGGCLDFSPRPLLRDGASDPC